MYFDWVTLTWMFMYIRYGTGFSDAKSYIFGFQWIPWQQLLHLLAIGSTSHFSVLQFFQNLEKIPNSRRRKEEKQITEHILPKLVLFIALLKLKKVE